LGLLFGGGGGVVLWGVGGGGGGGGGWFFFGGFGFVGVGGGWGYRTLNRRGGFKYAIGGCGAGSAIVLRTEGWAGGEGKTLAPPGSCKKKKKGVLRCPIRSPVAGRAYGADGRRKGRGFLQKCQTLNLRTWKRKKRRGLDS